MVTELLTLVRDGAEKVLGRVTRGFRWLMSKAPRIAVVSVATLVLAGLFIGHLADIAAVWPMIGALGLAAVLCFGLGVVLIREQMRRQAG